MRSDRAIIFFVRDERREAEAKPLPARFRAGGYALLNRRVAARLRGTRRADLIVVSESGRGGIHAEAHLRQRGEAFAERITCAVADTLALGYRHVVVVGNDCPTIAGADIELAFERLETGARYVAAPAADGGAYLIGTRAGGFDAPEFLALPWQSSRLFAALAALRGASALAILRRDFDTWSGANGERALDRLFATITSQPITLRTSRRAPAATRRKALTRIFLTAPPAFV